MARDQTTADSIAYAPFGLRAGAAARYVGYSESAFHERVKAGVFPKPVRDGGISVWMRDELEQALRDLRSNAEAKPEEDAWLVRIGS